MQVRILYFKEQTFSTFKHIFVIFNVLKPSYRDIIPRQLGLHHIVHLHSQENKNYYSEQLHRFNKVIICKNDTLFWKAD
jgi:gluconate kinase